MIKAFPTTDVLTVSTGVMLRKGADFQAVMDHFFPGIFTLGCAAMQPKASREIYRQLPGLLDFANKWGKVNADNCETFERAAIFTFGETVELDGPMNVNVQEINEAFESLTP